MPFYRLRRELKNRNQLISEQVRRISELESALASVRHNENVTQNVEDVAGNINRSDVSVKRSKHLPIIDN